MSNPVGSGSGDGRPATSSGDSGPGCGTHSSGAKSTTCVRGPCGQAMNGCLCFGPGEPLGLSSCGGRPRGRVERGRVGGDSNLLGRQRPQVPMISNAPSGFNALTAAAPSLGRTDSLRDRPEAPDSRCHGGQYRRVARRSGHKSLRGRHSCATSKTCHLMSVPLSRRATAPTPALAAATTAKTGMGAAEARVHYRSALSHGLGTVYWHNNGRATCEQEGR